MRRARKCSQNGAKRLETLCFYKHMQNIDTVAYRCFPLSYANAGINTIDLKKMTDRNVIEILVVVQHDSKHHRADRKHKMIKRKLAQSWAKETA